MKKTFLYIFPLILLTACGGKDIISAIEADDYKTVFYGNYSLNKIINGDNSEIRYIESGDNNTYKDSLLITENYNQGKGALVYANESLSALKSQEIGIENQKTEKFTIICKGKKQSAIQLSYQIKKSLKIGIPQLYMTHLFLEKNANTVIIWSFSSESKDENKKMQDAFKKINCQ